MKAFASFFLLIACTLPNAKGQDLFLESLWQNVISTPGLAVWAGGNESTSAPGVANPYSAEGIYLIESAIGQMTAENQAYPGAGADLSARAGALNLGAQGYRYTNDLAGLRTNLPTQWHIIFPGGFNPVTGQAYSSVPAGLNYDTNQLNQVEHDLRAWLRINPFDMNAAQQLVMLTEERMLPLEWSGTAALLFSEKARLGVATNNASNSEESAVGLARGYFQGACDSFSQLLGNPPDAALVEGQNPLLSTSVSNQVAQVLDDYLRNLSAYAQASLTDFQLRNLAGFYDPSQAQQVPGQLPHATQTLLDDVDATAGEIQMRLLLASPFQNLPAYTTSEAGRVQNYLAQIGRLHESILLGRITFIAGDSDTNSTGASAYYGEYTTSFVPIFSGLPNPQGGNSSFDIAMAQALDFVSYAGGVELAASNAIATAENIAYQYTSEHENLEEQYLTQLVNLCGFSTVDTIGNPIPDIFFAILAPGVRESTASQILTNFNYHLAQTGAIYQQWQALQLAQTNLLYASVQLSNTVATMLIKSEVGNIIASNDRQLATLVLADGQQIAGIDIQMGEAKAQEDLSIAMTQAMDAQKQASHSGIFGFLEYAAGIIAAPFTGGASLAVLALPGAQSMAQAITTTIPNACDQAAADLAIGQSQANTDRVLAQYNAQIQQISASEQAALQYNNADTTLLNLSADLNQLRLQAQAQGVQIQLASQAMDQERSKLSTLISQVGFVLRQYTRSLSLMDQNPQLSGNLLFARNAAIQRADDTFILAQQWAFLTAQSFAYKDNSPNSPAPNFVRSVLASRNIGAILRVLKELQSANTFLYTNAPNFKPVTFSLRNNFVQANQTEVQGTNLIYISFEPTPSGTNAAASQADWVAYLQRHLTTNQFGSPVLILDFATSLLESKVNGQQRNPLWTCDTYGGLLFSGTDNGNLYKGVQVSLATQGFGFPEGATAGFWVHLYQLATSSIRRQGFSNQSGNPSAAIRFFNFGPFSSEFTASANNLESSPGTDAFNERSPANDHWQLVINGDEISGGGLGSIGNNHALLNNLNQLSDIQLRFAIKSFTDQTASQQCKEPPPHNQ